MSVLDRFDLTDRVAIVTGAGGGLGGAMARSLAESGCHIVAAGRRPDPLRATAQAIEERGRRCLVRPTDVTRPAEVAGLVADALETFGRVDILINNAGLDQNTGIPLPDLTDAQWQTGIAQNLDSAFYCARAVIPHMLERRHGRIINIASGWGLRGGRNNWTYAAGKGAMIQLTRSLAMTYARDGIRASCIAPGLIPHFWSEAEVRRADERQPFGRTGRVEEIGPLAVFLASDAAEYLSGETVLLDGGAIAGGLVPAGVAPARAAEGAGSAGSAGSAGREGAS